MKKKKILVQRDIFYSTCLWEGNSQPSPLKELCGAVPWPRREPCALKFPLSKKAERDKTKLSVMP